MLFQGNDRILFNIDPKYQSWGDMARARAEGVLSPSYGKSFNQLTDIEKTQYFQDPDLFTKISPFVMDSEKDLLKSQIEKWKETLPMYYTSTNNSVSNMTDPQTSSTQPSNLPTQNYNVFAKLSPTEQKDVLINNPNVITPEGSKFYDPTTNTVNLVESNFTKSQRLDQERLAMELSRSLSGNLPSTNSELVRQTTFELGKRQLDPEFKSQREALATQLANQGIPINSEAYNSAMNRLERSQGEQLNNLSLQSQLQGIQTAEAQRQARFNEISSLLGRSQVGAGANFAQTQSGYQGLDLIGAEQSNLNRISAYNIARMQTNAQRDAAKWQAGGAAIGGIASGLGSFFSDIILKSNIVFENKYKNNLPIYTFEYINKEHGQGRYEGVMAQDVEKTYPQAVSVSPEGYKMVDYSQIGIEFRRV